MGDPQEVQPYSNAPTGKKTRKSSKDTTLKDLDGSLAAFMTILENAMAGLVRTSHSDTADRREASGTITHGNTYCVRPYKAHVSTGDAHVCSRAVEDAVNEVLSKAYIASARLAPVSGKRLLGLLKKTLKNLKHKDETNARNGIQNRKWPSIGGIRLYGSFSKAFNEAVNIPEHEILLANPWAPEDSYTQADEVAFTGSPPSTRGTEQFSFGSMESFGRTSEPFFYRRFDSDIRDLPSRRFRS